jgi:hypothetical protein
LVFDARELKTESDLSSRMAAFIENAGAEITENGENLSIKKINE